MIKRLHAQMELRVDPFACDFAMEGWKDQKSSSADAMARTTAPGKGQSRIVSKSTSLPIFSSQRRRQQRQPRPLRHQLQPQLQRLLQGNQRGEQLPSLLLYLSFRQQQQLFFQKVK